VELDLEFIPCCPLAWLLGLLLEIFCGDMTGHTAPDYRQPAPSAAEHMALKQKILWSLIAISVANGCLLDVEVAFHDLFAVLVCISSLGNRLDS